MALGLPREEMVLLPPQGKKARERQAAISASTMIDHPRVVKTELSAAEMERLRPRGILSFDRRTRPAKFRLYIERRENHLAAAIPFAGFSPKHGCWMLPLMGETVRQLFLKWPACWFTTDAYLMLKRVVDQSKVEARVLRELLEIKRGEISSEHIQGIGVYQPFPEQKICVNFIETAWANGYGIANLSEQGTGKTGEALIVMGRKIRRHREMGLSEPLFIVYAPLSTLYTTWVKSCELFDPDVRPLAIVGSNKAARVKMVEDFRYFDKMRLIDRGTYKQPDFFREEGRPNLLLVNHEIGKLWKKGTRDVPNELVQAFIDRVKAAPYSAVIVDEGHRFANENANQTESAQMVIDETDDFLMMTGTPGKPHKYYGLYSMIDRRILPCGKGDFERRYVKRVDIGNFSKIVDYPNVEELRRRVGYFSIRFKQEDISSIPEWFRTEQAIDLSPEQMEAYEAVEKNVITFVEGEKVSQTSVSGKFNALRNINSGYVKNEAGEFVYFNKNPKLDRLISRIEEELEPTEANPDQIRKVIVTCQRHAEIDMISKKFAELRKKDSAWADYHHVVVTGNVTDANNMARTKCVNAFTNDPKVRIFLGIESAFKEGVDLPPTLPQVCDIMFMYSLNYSPEDHDQVIKRIIRHGQTRKVRIEALLMNGTIDESIVDSLVYGIDICAVAVGDLNAIPSILKGRRRTWKGSNG